MSDWPTTLDEAHARMAASRGELEAIIAGLTPDEFELPSANGWTVRHQLLHVAAWESSVAAVFRSEPRGKPMRLDPAYFTGKWNADSINVHLMEDLGDMPLADVLAWFASSHQETLDVLATWTDADLQRPYDQFMDDQPGVDAPIVRWLAGDTWEHYNEHIALLRPATTDNAGR